MASRFNRIQSSRLDSGIAACTHSLTHSRSLPLTRFTSKRAQRAIGCLAGEHSAVRLIARGTGLTGGCLPSEPEVDGGACPRFFAGLFDGSLPVFTDWLPLCFSGVPKWFFNSLLVKWRPQR